MTWEEAVSWLRNQQDMQPFVYASYYDDPHTASADRFYQSEEWGAIRSFLRNVKGKRVLDVGSGRGISTYSFLKDGYSVTAIEPDESEIVGKGAIKKLLSSISKNINICSNIDDAKQHGPFDIIYCRAVLHHIQNLNKMCKELFSLAAPDAIFIATREHVIRKNSDKQRFFDHHTLHRLYGGENALLLHEYRNAIQFAGFKELKILSPYDSAINYSPFKTNSQMDDMVLSAISKKIPALMRKLIPKKILLQISRKYLSLRCNDPGMLFSFIARKRVA